MTGTFQRILSYEVYNYRMGVELKKEIAEDLILFKLRKIREEISIILDRWNYTSSDRFIDDVKSGKIHEGENDAIDLRQLVADEEQLSTIYNQIK